MALPRQPPSLNIPDSRNTVKVSIIDTTSHMSGFPANTFVEPQVSGFTEMEGRSFGFFIQHPGSGSKYDNIVFDLGVRKDWENSATAFIAALKANPSYSIEVEKDTAEILLENGVSLADVGGIIWSHWHFDHTGNPRRFPGTTDLIVGPGFKSHFVPSFPTDPDSLVDERLWEGRELREIDFLQEGAGLRIGNFQAFDFYGDGSFYLLDAPGHTVGHLSALARTTVDPPSFIFMGGDIAHHGGEFRPTEFMPLPQEVTPRTLKHGHLQSGIICPGEVFVSIHPKRSRTEPFFDPTPVEGGWHLNAEEATRSIRKMMEFDAYDNIFPVIAHDNSLLGVVDFYPKTANDWLAKGWKDKCRWGFLGSFEPYNK